MNTSLWPSLVNVAAPAACAALTALLATRWASRAGWVDGGSGAHKRPGEHFPMTGGPALLVGALCVWALMAWWGREQALFVPGRALALLLGSVVGHEVTLWPFGALLTAFAVGAIDDGLRDGLTPALKLVGQAACGVVLAAPLLFGSSLRAEEIALGVALVAATLVVLNVVNTFDHADGAALAIGVLGLAHSAPPFAAALAALAPFNLRRDSARPWGRKAILGDSGSHALGLLILVTPAAWPALVLPALDLARVCLGRARAGWPLWRGDRSHLAHRLARSGRSSRWIAAALALLAAPAALLPLAHPLWGALAGAVLTAAGMALALRAAPPELDPPQIALDVRGEMAREGADATAVARSGVR
mgnify:CR=1 FL=1